MGVWAGRVERAGQETLHRGPMADEQAHTRVTRTESRLAALAAPGTPRERHMLLLAAGWLEWRGPGVAARIGVIGPGGGVGRLKRKVPGGAGWSGPDRVERAG